MKKYPAREYTSKQASKLANSLGLPGCAPHIEIAATLAIHLGVKRNGLKSKKDFRLFLNEYFKKENQKIEGIEPFKKKNNGFVYKGNNVNDDSFLQSYDWRAIRMKILKRDGRKCACCGATPETGSVMNVDHIKPRKFFPELALDENNLQVLCHECNHGKGNWDTTDWKAEVTG